MLDWGRIDISWGARGIGIVHQVMRVGVSLGAGGEGEKKKEEKGGEGL